MKNLTVFLLVILKSIAVAQVSENLNNQLPDSLKPANINKISYREAEKILKYSAAIRFNTRSENSEIEQLCGKFTPLIKNLKTNDEKLSHAKVVLRYWFNRYTSREINTKSNILDSTDKFIEIYRKYIRKNSKNYKRNLAQYYALKGSIMSAKMNYPEAYTYLYNAIGISKIIGDTSRIAFTFGVLSTMHNQLELYAQTIMYCDSALFYDNKKNTNRNSNRSYNLTTKSYAFCSLFAATRLKEHRDSVISNVDKLVRSTKVPKYRSNAFDILARLDYYRGNYLRSISFTDSSLALSRGTELNEDQINSLLFKALCMIKIGKKDEGLDLVKKSKIQGSGPEAGKILQELYKSEKEKGNLSRAILYLERFQKFQDSSRSFKSRGQIFEIQQKYNLAARDLHIMQLRGQEKRNKLVAAGIGLVVCFFGLLFGIRFKNNQKKARLLVDQIHELTELQILRIENEREEERRRIGQELHDDLSGTIAAGIRHLRMMAIDISENENKIWLSEISDMLETSYNKVRGKSHELYLEENDANFWRAFDQNIDLFFAATSIKVSRSRETSSLLLTPEEKTTILLIIRESISNVIKHAKASEVEILIYSESGKLILEISDNGKGMSPESYSKNVGLKSIHERVLKLNGTMKISGRTPTGMNLRAEISITKHSHFF